VSEENYFDQFSWVQCSKLRVGKHIFLGENLRDICKQHSAWRLFWLTKLFDACVTDISICSHCGDITVALWHYLCNNKWEVLMINFPLLSNVRHRAMTTPVSPLSTAVLRGVRPFYSTQSPIGSFILARVPGQFLFVWKYSQNGSCPCDWISNSMFYTNPLLQTTIQPDMNYI